MQNKKGFIHTAALAALAAASIAISSAGSAGAAGFDDLGVGLERSHLQRSLEAARLRADYQRAYRRAKKVDVAPQRNAARMGSAPATLERRLEQLRSKIRRAERGPRVASPESVGVSTATLESIAACESGGDPAAVSSTGAYRGKYQFDSGTWAAVGGSGDPAAAPEVEQDYRAALLYARAGSGPWPVCGS